MTSNDRVPNNLIWVLDGFEYRESVREIPEGRNGAKLDELAEGKVGVVEAGFDDVGVDLLEILDAFAFGEKGERWMGLEEFVRWVSGGEDMKIAG